MKIIPNVEVQNVCNEVLGGIFLFDFMSLQEFVLFMISTTAWTYDMGPADCEEEDSRKHANEFAGFLRWITIALS